MRKKSGMGWHGERQRHSYSRRRIRTRQNILAPARGQGVSLPVHIFDDTTLSQVLKYNHVAGDREWIAEFDAVGGHIILNDVQFNNERDASYLSWDVGDEYKNLGYIHYHPPGISPVFTCQDYLLGAIVHRRRRNKSKSYFTFMSLVTPSYIRTIAIRPSVGREEMFRRLMDKGFSLERSRQLRRLVGDMRRSGELIELDDVSLY